MKSGLVPHYGEYLATIPDDGKSHTGCMSGCQSRSDCKGFTIYEGSCYLKEDFNPAATPVSYCDVGVFCSEAGCQTFYSTTIKTPTPPKTPTGVPRANWGNLAAGITVIYNTNLATSSFTNLNACKLKCEARADCFGVNVYKKSCALKGRFDPKTASKKPCQKGYPCAQSGSQSYYIIGNFARAEEALTINTTEVTTPVVTAPINTGTTYNGDDFSPGLFIGLIVGLSVLALTLTIVLIVLVSNRGDERL